MYYINIIVIIIISIAILITIYCTNIIIIILIIITHSVRIQKGKAVVGRCSNIIIISILVIIFCTNIMVSPDPKRQGCSRQVQPSPPSEPNLESGPAKMPAATAMI